MAKIKPARKNAAKPSAADWSKAIPCLFILLIAFAAIAILMYFAMTSSVK